jgi:hypothetical protein
MQDGPIRLLRTTASEAGVEPPQQLDAVIPPVVPVLKALEGHIKELRIQASAYSAFTGQAGEQNLANVEHEVQESRRLGHPQREGMIREYRHAWRTAHYKCPVKDIQKAAGVDAADYHRWRRGELPDESVMSKNLVRVLTSGQDPRKFLRQRRKNPHFPTVSTPQ